MGNEAQTRAELIDRALRLAGWDLTDRGQVVEEFGIDVPPEALAIGEGTPGRRQFADYALLSGGRVLAVLEAKRTSRSAELGQEQARQYAEHIRAVQGGTLPLALYSNGHDHFLWDSERAPPARLAALPTRRDLEWMHQQREQELPLAQLALDVDIAGRGYQLEAIRTLLDGIEGGRRRFLLVMATGTGKTRTAIGLVDALLRARWAKRVLFLVDRIALRDQALEAFREFLPNDPVWPATEGHRVETRWAANRRLYCATYPTMLNLIRAGSDPATYISPCFFDLVIADESHRSIYNTYLEVLRWFHARQLGLTATPKDLVDHDTFRLFDCEANDATFAYTYEEAVAHDPPYLCEFEVLAVQSRFQLEGIRGGSLPATFRQQLIDQGLDPDDVDFEGSDLERKVTNRGTNALLVREFMDESIKDPTGTLPGKSIVFAVSVAHARQLSELFDQLYPQHAGKLARVLVSEDSRVHGKGGLLDQFKHEDMPRVAISVDMLDTGIDVPEVVNLVFAKPVFSYTKFWQMIGRGTRVLPAPPSRKPWCPEKDRFLILDCWDNFGFFEMQPRGREPGQQTTALPVRLFLTRLDALEAALAAGEHEATGRLVEDLRADIAELPADSALLASSRAVIEEVSTDDFWSALSATRLGVLRNVVAPCLRARAGGDAKRLRFEIAAATWMGAHLCGDGQRVDALRTELVEQIGQLPRSVNTVQAQGALIDEALTTTWWTSADVAQLADLSRRLAPLMHLRQPPREAMLELDLTDIMARRQSLTADTEHAGQTTQAYRERIESELRSVVDRHPVMARIAAGELPDDMEVEELAGWLHGLDPAITGDLLCRVYDLRSARLVELLRHVLGIERLSSWEQQVATAFEEFVVQHPTLTGLQHRALGALRSYLVRNRQVERQDLVGPPFTQIHPKGIPGAFEGQDLKELLSMAQELVA